MATMKLRVVSTELKIVTPFNLVSTQINYDKCEFLFDSSWDGYVKTAVFYSDTTGKKSIALDENDTCVIPWENLVNSGVLYIGVFGIKGGSVLPTNWVNHTLCQGSYVGADPTQPTNDIYIQLVSDMNAFRDAEAARVIAEGNRVISEGARVSREDGRVSAESGRVTAENTRVESENTRNVNEANREAYYSAYKVIEAYNSSAPYNTGNKVTYNGSTYQCTLDCAGVTPTNTSNWIMIASKGVDGVGGNMMTSVYDPTAKNADAFDSSNHSYSNVVSGLTATTTKTAIDELDANIGNKSTLTTTSKTDLVGAVNETYDNTPHKLHDGYKYLINNPYSYGGALSLKGQLHCHSTNSDGTYSPADLATAYKNAGYGFLAITDHDVITPNPNVSGITWIGNSVEETIYRHITAYDIDARCTGQNVQDLLSFHRNNGKMTSIAHPTWESSYIIDENEIKGYYDFNFLEVFNGIVNGNSEYQWDKALSFGNKIFAISTDDCHSIDSFNKAWVVVKTNENTKAAIINSLRNGNFYASTGNDINISLVDNVIMATSSASSNISFIGRDGRILNSSNGTTSATYTIRGDESYVRVKSTKTSDSTIAWSQPIFIDTLKDNNKKTLSEIIRSDLSSIQRQAIINGNFDVWQRGVSITNPTNTAPTNCIADKFAVNYNAGVFTLPAITHSRQVCTAELDNSIYCYRVAVDGAGSGSMASGLQYALYTRIENGTRCLCGTNKKVTLSFWARSSIAGKRIGVNFSQRYGTGGNPSSNEYIKGKYWTLTDKWKKYVCTIDTYPLSSKSLGTNNDDYLQIRFELAWDATNGSASFDTSVTDETFVGAGYIDLTQVQLCSGDVALPFMAKSFAEELKACERYYEKSYSYAVPPLTASPLGAMFSIATGTSVASGFRFKTDKRIPPTVAIISPSGTLNRVWSNLDVDVTTDVNLGNIGDSGVRYLSSSGLTAGTGITYHYTAVADI